MVNVMDMKSNGMYTSQQSKGLFRGLSWLLANRMDSAAYNEVKKRVTSICIHLLSECYLHGDYFYAGQ